MVVTSAKFAERKKKVRIRRALLCLFFLAGVIGALILIARINTLSVHTVSIEGENSIAEEELQALVNEEASKMILGIIPRSNIFLYPKKIISSRIMETWSRISAVDVNSEQWGAVTIHVIERKPEALWCAQIKQCYFLDKDGIIYAEAADFSDSIYLVFYGGIGTTTSPLRMPLMVREQFHTLLDFIETIEHYELTPRAVTITNDEYHISFHDDMVLYVRQNQDLERVAEHLKASMSDKGISDGKGKLKPLIYLDLRFVNKVYYKLK